MRVIRVDNCRQAYLSIMLLVDFLMNNFPKMIKAAMALRNINSDELAKRLDSSSGTINQYRSGALTPSWETASKIAKALNFSLPEFTQFGEYEDV